MVMIKVGYLGMEMRWKIRTMVMELTARVRRTKIDMDLVVLG